MVAVGLISSLVPKPDGGMRILTHEVANVDDPDMTVRTYQVTASKPFTEVETTPIALLRKIARHEKKWCYFQYES
ncbi:hypothetical protein CEXT_448331 [Caerostris extrusa]|uniref:Uncharacterized protein n=1 Tax=Caerostris extrusa TaxID=172846 RepID=A0AAV4XIV4_CAEEX|nr:hypothetical protein CEXT_448331 [Caerostris extrusa]